MSRSVNKVILVGNVGSDPEVRTLPSGDTLAKLSLATGRTFNDRSGQKQEKTEWHRLTVFGKLADVVEQYVRKGDRLYVEGRIEYNKTDDGKFFTDIVVHDLVMLGGSGEKREVVPASKSAPRSPFDADDSDLPFS